MQPLRICAYQLFKVRQFCRRKVRFSVTQDGDMRKPAFVQSRFDGVDYLCHYRTAQSGHRLSGYVA